MASVHAEEPSQTSLQYQTCILKVSIHCEGCKNKVKKVLKSIQGVSAIDIDSEEQKVTISGKVDAQTLINKLVTKTGKHAELCHIEKTENNDGHYENNNTNVNGEQGKSGKKEKKKRRKGKNSNEGPPVPDGAPPCTGSEMGSARVAEAIDPSRSSPPQQYVISYNAAPPTLSGAPVYYTPPSPNYTYAAQLQYLPSFEILSEDNPNGCYIM